MTTDDITLYTNHGCPWAHRAHIALAELKIPFKEVIIDLNVPREPSYLAINPRGLVPTLVVNGETIIESGIVAQFLADKYAPNHLVRESSAKDGALQRARIAIFVDAFQSKVQAHLFKILGATDEERPAHVDAAVQGVVKEVEPLLQDAKPFFGGSDKITLAEVLTGSFVVRLLSFAKEGKLYPADTLSKLETQAPAFYRWTQAVAADPSVNGIYDEEAILTRTHARIAKLRAAKA